MRFLFLVFIIMLTSAYAEKAYLINLRNMDNTLTYGGLKLGNAEIIQQRNGTYELIIMDFSGNPAFTNTFSSPMYAPVTVAAPYAENAKEIVIKASQRKLLTIPVIQFADTCYNNVCEPHESYEACPSDCASGLHDDYCDSVADGVCDPDCAGDWDSDCKTIAILSSQNITEEKIISQEIAKPNNAYHYFLLLILPLIILIILTAYKQNNRLENYIKENLGKGYSVEQIRKALIDNGYGERKVNRAMKSVTK